MEEIKKLTEQIKNSDIKQKNLAKVVGVTPEHLNAMLNGRLKMNHNMYLRIKYWYEKNKT